MSGHSLSRKECLKHFAKTEFDNFITDTVLCAYNPGRGACHGDSGSYFRIIECFSLFFTYFLHSQYLNFMKFQVDH